MPIQWLYEVADEEDWYTDINGRVYPEFWIVSREYWDKHECISDDHISNAVRSILPEGFDDEVMESCFQFSGGDVEHGKKLLEQAGFVSIDEYKEKRSYDCVHQGHCCVYHGCKFHEEDCPVKTGKIEQFHVCEDCDDKGLKTVEEAKGWAEIESDAKLRAEAITLGRRMVYRRLEGPPYPPDRPVSEERRKMLLQKMFMDYLYREWSDEDK